MSDQTDLNNVLEGVLRGAFDENQEQGDNHHPHNDQERGLEHEDDDEEIDYNKQLADLLGEVDQHAAQATASHDEIPNHQHDDNDEHGEQDYQIDFANVVQGIMDHYGEEEQLEKHTEQEQAEPPALLQEEARHENSEAIPEQAAHIEEPLQNQHNRAHDQHFSAADLINPTASKQKDIQENENDKTEKLLSEHHFGADEHVNNDDDEAANFEDILAQLANEAVDKVQQEAGSDAIEEKIGMTAEDHEKEFQAAINDALKAANAEPEPEPKQPPVQEQVPKASLDVISKPEVSIPKPLPATALPHSSTKVTPKAQDVKANVPAKATKTTQKKPTKTTTTKANATAGKAREKAPSKKTKKQQEKVEPPKQGQQVQQQQQQQHLSEDFLQELEQLAGDREKTDDLQAALAEMVKNVVEGNETELMSSDDLSESEDDQAAIDQNAMNDILQNAFRLAMDQQVAQTDKNLDQHKAALDDAISSIFASDKSKASAVAKMKKGITSVTQSKTKPSTIEKVAKITKEPVKPRKTYQKKQQAKPSAESSRETASPSSTTAATKPSTAKVSEPVSKSTIEAAQAQDATKKPVLLVQKSSDFSKPVSSPPKAVVATTAQKSLTQTTQSGAAVEETVSKQKGKSKLSIAETLALTRSSMKGAPRRDYSNISTLDQALKTAEKAIDVGQSIDSTTTVAQGASSATPISKAPTVSKFQSSTTAQKSSLTEAIKQMSNALQQPSSSAKAKSSMKDSAAVSGSASATQKDVSGVGAATALGGTSGNEKSLLDALILAKQFMSKQPEETSKDTLNVIDSAIENLKKSSGGGSMGASSTGFGALSSNRDPSKGGSGIAGEKTGLGNGAKKQSTFPFSNATTSSMTAAITQAISSISDTAKSNAEKTSTATKKPKVKIEAPEIKEQVRLKNRERKKKWREINAERNRDNDLRFRVIKRAVKLFGEEDSDKKKKWIEEEVEKRKKKRLERFSHSLQQFDINSSSSSTTDPNNNDAKKNKSASGSLLKGLMDILAAKNINSSAATQAISDAINKADTSDPNLTKNLTNVISDIIASHSPSPLVNNAKQAFNKMTTGGSLDASSKANSNPKTSAKTTTTTTTAKPLVPNGFKSATSIAIGSMAKPDSNLSKVNANAVTTHITKAGNTSVVDAISKARPAVMEKKQPSKADTTEQKISIDSSMKNLTISNAPLPPAAAPKVLSSEAEKRKTEDQLASTETKKQRSVSPQPQPQPNQPLSQSKPVQAISTRPNAISTPSSSATVTATVKRIVEAHHNHPLSSKEPTQATRKSGEENTLQSQTEAVPLPSTPSFTPQRAVAITEPFKMAWSSKTSFRLPQYKKPGATPPPTYTSSRSPTPPISGESPRPGIDNSNTNNNNNNTAGAGVSGNNSPRRPLQRPNFSKAPTLQRPRW